MHNFMQQAILLAKKGRYTCQPNPMVGAIVVHNGETIGTGYHKKAGEPHAEINAITDALTRKKSLKNADLYVSLEPCSHYGRTPPCCETIVQHKFKRIIIGCLDPNPQVAGKGVAWLKSVGFEVIVNIEKQAATELNAAFFYFMKTSLPYLVSKIAASLDGKTALANGKSQWITGKESRKDVHLHRLAADAILTGFGTFAIDNPQLNARLQWASRQPQRVLLDTNGKSLRDSKFHAYHLMQSDAHTMPTWILVDQAQLTELQDLRAQFALNIELKGIKSLQEPATQTTRLDLKKILTTLAQAGFKQVYLEAGATLTSQFLQQQLTNEIHLYLAPKFLGHTARSSYMSDELRDLPHSNSWNIAAHQIFGDDIKISLRKKKL